MKKLATLMLTAGLVFASVAGASAVDFKAKGQYIMSFDYGQGSQGQKGYGFNGEDSFEAEQRFRIQVDAVASESLSGTIYFEIGESFWGKGSQGAALGTDGTIVEVKHAYLDWIVPNTELKVRMGLQAIGLPSYTAGTSQVFVDDVAGIVLNNKFNDNVSVTAFWARPYNDNYGGENTAVTHNFSNDSRNFLDNVDAFALVVPMQFDGFKITPWGMYTAVGRNFGEQVIHSNTDAKQDNMVFAGLTPLAGTYVTPRAEALDAYGSVWHLGLTGSVNFNNPFTFAWDVNYGSADLGPEELERAGWYASILAEYKMDWGTPGLYAWYSSGDDGSQSNGSERMPTFGTVGGTNEFSSFAFNGHKYISREGVIGNTMIGTWGIGGRVKDFSFMEDLKHTFAINYFNGTNHGDNARVATRAGQDWTTAEGMYLTTEDWALEFSLVSSYKIYENLTMNFEANYLILDMDQDLWGDHYSHDSWNVNTSFVYSF